MSGGNSRCISRQHRRDTGKRSFVPLGISSSDVLYEADQIHVIVGYMLLPKTLAGCVKC